MNPLLPLAPWGLFGTVLFALVPALAVAVLVFGMNLVYIIAVSLLTATFTEAAARKLTRRKVTIFDLSALVTGLLFAFLMPPTTPLWVVGIGSFIAIALGKELFGGLGKNIFNPALLARVILMFTPLSVYTAKYVRPFFWKEVGFFTPVSTSVVNRPPLGSKEGLSGKCQSWRYCWAAST